MYNSEIIFADHFFGVLYFQVDHWSAAVAVSFSFFDTPATCGCLHPAAFCVRVCSTPHVAPTPIPLIILPR